MARASTSQRVEHWVDADLTPNSGERGLDATERVALRPQPLRDPDHRAHKAALAQALFGVVSEPVRIGRFRVLARLGEGGMGVVYAGHDDELDRRVAIKLLHVDGDLGESRARLLREAQALARLSHPNVVSLFEVGEAQGQLFVAMEHVHGQTLHAWMHAQPGPRAWQEVLAVFLAAGRGLAAAHEVGLVHRDFKPGNVMLGADGRVRVLDFGLARALATTDVAQPVTANAGSISVLGTPLTMTGSVVGTPAYMAPEQLHATASDPRSDQFSFCVALFEALYGARPFAGATQGELFAAVNSEAVRPVPSGSKVPAWLRAAVVRGLARDPAARWPSMPALLAELTRDHHARRRRWTLAAVMAGLGLVPLGLGVAAGIEHLEHGARSAACEASGDEVSQVWNVGARASLYRGLGPDATPAAIEGVSEAATTIQYAATRWRDDRIAGCMSDPDGYVHPQHLKERQDQIDLCFARGLDDLRTTLAVAGAVDPITAGRIDSSELFAFDDCLAASTTSVEYPTDPAARRRWQEVRGEQLRARLATAVGDPLAAEAMLVAVVPKAHAMGSKRLEIDAAHGLSRAQFMAGHRRAAWASFETTMPLAPDHADRRLVIFDALPLELALGATTGRSRLAVSRLLLDDRSSTAALADESLLEIVDLAAKPVWRSGFPTMKSWIFRDMLPAFSASAQLRLELGDFEGAEEFARNALAAAGFHAHHPALATDLLLTLGRAELGLDRHARAAESLRDALAQASTDAAARTRLPLIHLALADLALARGDLDEATHELAVTGALADEGEANDDRLIPALTLGLARLHHARGDHDGAAQLLQRARQSLLASHGAARRLLVTAELELGRVALARDDLAAAASALDTALRINESLVGETHVSHAPILAVLAQLQRAQGQGTAAEATLERARASIAGHRAAPSQRAALAD